MEVSAVEVTAVEGTIGRRRGRRTWRRSVNRVLNSDEVDTGEVEEEVEVDEVDTNRVEDRG
jgi:hypothetical protein